ncbi:hypothetical protein JOB18_046026 [Solea senegalensis]|uniref:Uncharacterized protein n=1 Tax=Solea senegalensis TaxID=28829 RepID=A0AAV6QXQ5_SOLSE|nr:hypothetical protein JOB18_046026 [Solea senegalensis]
MECAQMHILNGNASRLENEMGKKETDGYKYEAKDIKTEKQRTKMTKKKLSAFHQPVSVICEAELHCFGLSGLQKSQTWQIVERSKEERDGEFAVTAASSCVFCEPAGIGGSEKGEI